MKFAENGPADDHVVLVVAGQRARGPTVDVLHIDVAVMLADVPVVAELVIEVAVTPESEVRQPDRAARTTSASTIHAPPAG